MSLLLFFQLLDLVFVVCPSVNWYTLVCDSDLAGVEGERGQTSCRGLCGQESHLSLQVFDPLLRVDREVSVIRQPGAAVGTGVHAWCL
jgi:hypothetical protein